MIACCYRSGRTGRPCTIVATSRRKIVKWWETHGVVVPEHVVWFDREGLIEEADGEGQDYRSVLRHRPTHAEFVLW